MACSLILHVFKYEIWSLFGARITTLCIPVKVSNIVPITLALCVVLLIIYCPLNYAKIIGRCLTSELTFIQISIVLHINEQLLKYPSDDHKLTFHLTYYVIVIKYSCTY